MVVFSTLSGDVISNAIGRAVLLPASPVMAFLAARQLENLIGIGLKFETIKEALQKE